METAPLADWKSTSLVYGGPYAMIDLIHLKPWLLVDSWASPPTAAMEMSATLSMLGTCN